MKQFAGYEQWLATCSATALEARAAISTRVYTVHFWMNFICDRMVFGSISWIRFACVKIYEQNVELVANPVDAFEPR